MQEINIIPEPVVLKIISGKFSLTENSIIYSDHNLKEVSEYLQNFIFPSTGFKLLIKEEAIKIENTNSISSP